MISIRIINGSTLLGGQLVSTGTVADVDEGTAAHLVMRGAAEYAEEESPYSPTAINTSLEFTATAYEKLNAAELRTLCDERGLKYKKNASAGALRKMLEEDDAAAEDGMPVLRAAEPVDA